MNRYYHWGQMGDIVYAMPTIQQLGPGVLVSSMRKERLDSMRSFLMRDSNIVGVEHDPRGRMLDWSYRPPGITHDLNTFRSIGLPLHTTSLIAAHLRAFDLPTERCWKPWLRPWRGDGGYAIVARSSRYHNQNVDWASEVAYLREKYGDVIFIGLDSEHANFVEEFGSIEHATTPTLNHIMDRLTSAAMFSGNHSLPLAIAQGVGCPRRIEVAPMHSNCEYPEDPLEGRVTE